MANRTHLADLRGAARLACDATQGVTDIVEKMHRTIQLRPGPLGLSATDRPAGITGFVYRRVRQGIHWVGRGIDASLAPVGTLLPQAAPSPGQDAYRAVLNGLYGDHLARTDNPLAITMSLHVGGQQVDVRKPVRVLAQQPGARQDGKLLILVHGLCMNDRMWHREGHDHGAALADDLDYQPLYLRYNSGLPVASNGRNLAQTLESLLANMAAPPAEVAIIGHSMGGLVARSACHHAQSARHQWPKYLRKLVFLGTPHHGAPLERAGHRLDRALEISPYLAPFSRIGRARSAGITDLRNGAVSGNEEIVALPSGVKSYCAAAVRAARRGAPGEQWIGDGLVPLNSALGRHADPAKALVVPTSQQWTGFRMGHLELLNRPEVYAQLRRWLG